MRLKPVEWTKMVQKGKALTTQAWKRISTPETYIKVEEKNWVHKCPLTSTHRHLPYIIHTHTHSNNKKILSLFKCKKKNAHQDNILNFQENHCKK